MWTSSNHTKAFVQCCHGNETVASSRTLLSDHVLRACYVSWLLQDWSGTGVGDSSTPILEQPTDITSTQYTKCRLCSDSWRWASKARNMQRPLILNNLNSRCITLILLCWCYIMHGQQDIKSEIKYLLSFRLNQRKVKSEKSFEQWYNSFIGSRYFVIFTEFLIMICELFV
jgi:hypothetical protein